MAVKKLSELSTDQQKHFANEAGLCPEDEIVNAEFENCIMYFSVEELSDEFFGGLRVADALFQKYANILAANLDVVSDHDGNFVTITRSNFNDSFGDMMQDLHDDFIKNLNRRHDALYRIALASIGDGGSGITTDQLEAMIVEEMATKPKPKTFNGYVFYNDETATLIEIPSFTDVPGDLEAVTDDMVREFLWDHINEEWHPGITKEMVMSWSRAKAAQAIWDLCTLIIDTVVLIPKEHESLIKTVGNVLAESMGSDSSTYSACKSFNTILKGLAVKTLPFPCDNSDIDYKDIE
jgi:hypothetical protein